MASSTKIRRCAVYTRKSSEEGLEQEFNSLDAQREAGAAYVRSQVGEGWRLVETHYDDGGISGGTMERPALKRLLADIEAGKVHVVVVYKVDRLTRSLADFAKLVEVFERCGVSFVSVTQQFNTTTSMGRLMLNVLLSFAQFEREVTGERIRDKITASKRKGMWMGGVPPIGYRVEARKLIIVDEDARLVRHIFDRYCELGSITLLARELACEKRKTRIYTSASGRSFGRRPFSRGHLHRILTNRMYRGEVVHQGTSYPGEHDAIVDEALWGRVQSLIEENRSGRKARASAPSARLAGRVFDDADNRMTHTVARKGSRRYRYYVSSALAEGRRDEAGSVSRVQARLIEAAVARAVGERSRAAAGRVSTRPAAALTGEEVARRGFEDVTRVTIFADRLRIELRQGTGGDQAERPDGKVGRKEGQWETTVLEVRFSPGPGRGSVRTLAEPGPYASQEARSEPLIRAVVRGHAWAQRLLSGEAGSMEELARTEGVTARYVSRLVNCAFLAPDIVEEILAGYQSPTLSIDSLRDPLPVGWAAQRRRLGCIVRPVEFDRAVTNGKGSRRRLQAEGGSPSSCLKC